MKAVIGQTTRRQVAFVGPFGVGKTTAVRAISDTTVVETEVRRSGIPKHVRPQDLPPGTKMTTTVGLDYGEWFGGGGTATAVIGTPGQDRFGVMRRAAIPRGTAIVLWLYGQNDYALDEAAEWLGYLAPDLARAPLTVAVTRLGGRRSPHTLEDFRAVVERFVPGAPVLAADPRDREDVVAVMNAAMSEVVM